MQKKPSYIVFVFLLPSWWAGAADAVAVIYVIFYEIPTILRKDNWDYSWK